MKFVYVYLPNSSSNDMNGVHKRSKHTFISNTETCFSYLFVSFKCQLYEYYTFIDKYYIIYSAYIPI